MSVQERILDEATGHYEQRFAVALSCGSKLPFVRRPVAITPPEGIVCCVDNGPRFGVVPRRSGASFRDGKWIGLKFEPTHWTDMENPGA